VKNVAFLKTLAVLVIGFLLGTGFGWWSFRRHLGRFADPQVRYQHMLDRLGAKLALRPEQKTKVSAILEAERAQIEAVQSDARPKFDRIHKSAVSEVRRILNADQQKALDALEAQFEARRKGHGGWGAP
jgi:hypothetical protein